MAKKIDLGVLGTSGLKQSGGIIEEEFHPRLKGTFGPKVYREMADNSSTIGAINFLIDALVRQVEWRVEPAGSDKTALAAATFLEECLVDMSMTFEDVISEVLTFLTYGWSYFEIVYKLRKGLTGKPETNSQYNDGKIGWRKISLRAQDTLEKWEFDDRGRLVGMHQCDETSGFRAFIPIEKAILFRTKINKNNPEGRSIFRNAYIDYYYLKRISEIEAIGIDRDMTGLLVMEVPEQILNPNASADLKLLRADIETMLAQLKRDEREYALVPSTLTRDNMPSGYKLSLLSSGGSRQIDTTQVKEYYKINILQSVLAQFIQLGVSGAGSFALASSQTNLFAVALGAYLKIISSTFNKHAVGRLMTINGIPPGDWPELVHGDIEAPPLGEVGAYIQALSAAGQLPDDDNIQRKLLEFAKLPMPKTEEGEHVQKHNREGAPLQLSLPLGGGK